MGNCLSSQAVVDPNHAKGSKAVDGMLDSVSTMPLQHPHEREPHDEPNTPRTVQEEDGPSVAMSRGYSSGASTNDGGGLGLIGTSGTTGSGSGDGSSDGDFNSSHNDRAGYEDADNDNGNNNYNVSDSTLMNRRNSHVMDRLRLRSMRDVMRANGDLTRAVVRMETSFFGQAIESIYDGVHGGPILGEGVAGVVRLVTHRATRVQYACKILDLGLVQTEEGLLQLRDEISIMCQLDHPNIVRIEEVYASPDTIYLLQELCLGGDLFDRLDEQPNVHYTEAQCAKLIKQMVSAVRYLHSKGVIHRDLKLENFIFSTTDANSAIKLIDFGLSKYFDLGEKTQLTEAVGTPYTVAPEVLKGSYDEKADIWSVGVITYLLLCGETPFGGCYPSDCMAKVRKSILSGSFKFEPVDIWEQVSPLAKKFVTRLLNVDPHQRPTAKQVQRDEWLQVYGRKPSSEGNKLSPRIVDALVNFKEYSEMRRLLHEVLSFTLLPEQIEELRVEFEKIESGDGEITLAGLKQVLVNPAGAGALGGLTEEEVEDIFDALRVNKNDSKIHWHEFIAAGLSQCKYDDRNLQLAFDRFDSDRKGYICFNDLTALLGHAPETLENLNSMWAESMLQCKCKDGRINYDDFLLLMKGQTRRRQSGRPSMVWNPAFSTTQEEMKVALPEDPETSATEGADHCNIPPTIPEDEPITSVPRPQCLFVRKRSLSLNAASFGSQLSEPITIPCRVSPRPSLAANGDLVQLIAADYKAPLVATREEYKKHRGVRTAILQASKVREVPMEDQKQSVELGMPLAGAGLIMKRGTQVPPELESEHQRMLFDAAVRRGGRRAHPTHTTSGHQRKRTHSDITGMLVSTASQSLITTAEDSLVKDKH